MISFIGEFIAAAGLIAMPFIINFMGYALS